MALSSSTSSIHKSVDVFLSFRGDDTRKNFVDHLYYALQQRSIYPYKDEEEIKKGERICDELNASIEDSKFYIIVFSKNYASSSWCLNELLKIMECHKMTEHTVYPVFYDVEPSEVRNQSGEFGKAFAKHKNSEAAGKWREALKETADLAGWVLKNTADGHEARFIQQIVEKLSLELRSINVCTDKNLVGMDTRIDYIVSSLETAFDDVRMIGIKGIGGGGKTTLARAVFNKISFQFEGKNFIENVREVSKASLSGLKSLQSQVLSNVLVKHGINVGSVSEGKNMMSWMMRGRKVLLVLDDVDHVDQLEALAGDTSWFKPGSIIIITTRDEQVLVAHKVKLIHNVHLLSNKEALCLFSRYVFGREILYQDFEELSGKVVCYAAGLPLTVKVLGSFLCGKSKLEWIDAVARLKTIPPKETLKKLELSYIGLDDDYKEIFLDVATILKGRLKDSAIEALESCGFHARIGLRVLEQKSLITIDDYKCVSMHDQLEEMGRNIVRCSTSPNNHSRLWDTTEIEDILANDLGTEATRCIQLYHGGLNPEIIMKGLRKMKELRSLDVAQQDFYSNTEINKFMPNFLNALGYLCCNWKFNKVSPFFPNSLRYLHWYNYPFRHLPETFQANNLVALQMAHSDIVQLWQGGERKILNKLRFLYLSGPKLRTFDLGLTPNLETLTLAGYGELVELYMSVKCINLRSLKLHGSKLKTLDLGLTPNLENLDLNECDNLVELCIPNECQKLISLKFASCSMLRTLHVGLSPNLEKLDLDGCNDLLELHLHNECLNLKNLNLRLSKMKTLDLRLAPNLETIFLSCKDLVEFHMPYRCLHLRSLVLRNSKFRTLDIGLTVTPTLDRLELTDCYYLEELHMADECQKLTSLFVSHSMLRTLDLWRSPNLKVLTLYKCNDLRTVDLRPTPNLEYLELKSCYNLEELQMADVSRKLKDLVISRSKLRTLDLGLTPNLEELDLKECYSLVELHAPIRCLENLDELDLRGCLGFTSFSYCKNDDPCIVDESLEVGPLAKLNFTLERCPFHPDNNLPKFKFKCFHKEDLPSLTRCIEQLISEGSCGCTKLEMFSRSICGLQDQRKPKLKGSIPEVPSRS